jgi:hypothetical protein
MVQIVKTLRREKVKLKIGSYRFPGELHYCKVKGATTDRIFFRGFGFVRGLNEEIKSSFSNYKYHGFDDVNPLKVWSCADNQHNQFQLEYLKGGNPYARYDLPVLEATSNRPLYDHQLDMKGFILTRHYCIIAGEMGVGKSLSMIDVLEELGVDDLLAWYVGPKAGVAAVNRELKKWDSKVSPRMFTYQGMVKAIREWTPGAPPPRVVFFDESSKLKGEGTQQSLSAAHLADNVRDYWGDDGFVVLMSGTPSPKTPLDWWMQCRIACPGFLKEAKVSKLNVRMSLNEQRKSASGGMYPHRISWLDDENKCAKCGNKYAHPKHGAEGEHPFQKSVNEVANLYKRIRGLVIIKLKKECLDLPEKRYEVIRVRPTVDMLRAAKLIRASSPRAITALTLLRELSDGFQYVDQAVGKEECKNCKGKKEVLIKVPIETVDKTAPQEVHRDQFEEKKLICDNCGGTGETTVYERGIDKVSSPKDDYFIEDLEAHEECGRYIVWGGFTGSIDRLVEIAHKYGWATLRYDRKVEGRSAMGEILDPEELLSAMDLSHKEFPALKAKYPKICFVGHPQAGGMALTLTGSPVELFYSNTFHGEARMQAEDRAHRIGMDENRGLIIKDLIMFKSDLLVLKNLQTKKRLQNLTLGEMEDAFTRIDIDEAMSHPFSRR